MVNKIIQTIYPFFILSFAGFCFSMGVKWTGLAAALLILTVTLGVALMGFYLYSVWSD